MRRIAASTNASPYYSFPRTRVIKHLVRNMPLRTSTLRSLGSYANVLAIETTMDKLALAAGIDPIDFRLDHLKDERAQVVLRAVAELAQWGAPRRRPGAGRGLAFARYNNLKAYAAIIVDLEVNDAADVCLRRICIAADAGQIVDRDGLALQLEGAALQTASWTLYEQVTFDERGISSLDWETYPVLRFDNVPEVKTVLIDRPGYLILALPSVPSARPQRRLPMPFTTRQVCGCNGCHSMPTRSARRPFSKGGCNGRH